MAIHYSFHSEGDFLLVKASGFDENLQEVENYGMAIIEAAIKHNSKRILCDETELEYRLNTIDTFASAEFIATNVPNVVRVALVCNAKFKADADFWENVAYNRGLSAKFFQQREDALAWLKK